MMRGLLRLLLALVSCSHPHLYRERRPLHGVQVPHWVCPACGAAWPVLKRTPKEHRQMAQAGAVRPLVAVRETKANVTPMRQRGRRA